MPTTVLPRLRARPGPVAERHRGAAAPEPSGAARAVPLQQAMLAILTPAERRQLGSLAVLVVLAACLEAAAVTAIYPFLLVATNPASVTPGGTIGRLYALSGARSLHAFLLEVGYAILALVVLSSLVGAYTTWRKEWFVRRFEHGLSVRMLRYFLYQPYSYFIQHNTAEMQRRLLSDPRDISDGVLEPMLEIVQRGAAVLAIILVLLALQPAIALAVGVVFGGVYFGIFWLGRNQLQRSSEEVVAASQRSAKSSAEALAAIKVLKVTNREEHFVRHYEDADRVMSFYRGRYGIFARLPRFIIEGLTFVFLMVVLLFILASGGDLVASVPVIGMFAFAGFRLMPAAHGIVTSASRFRFARPVLAAVASDLAEPPPALSPVDVPPLRLHERILVDDVSFVYEASGTKVLSGIRFDIPRGTRVGIVGRTGSGKTTLLDLLLGLLTPTSGTVKIDGKPLGGELVARWHRSVSYVPQQVIILDDTLARNIAFGVPDAQVDIKRVVAAARTANIHDFIVKDLPSSYETVVGERGIRLSGGQRQRIGIARALYEDKDVIVFDEATSEVDTLTERAINDAIASLSRTKTIFVVAHRFSAIRSCDRVLLLDAGSIVAQGTYEELLKNPKFRELAES